MRILIVHPGPAWSVADVAAGWRRALVELGHNVWVFDFDCRLEFFGRAHLQRPDGTFYKAFTDEQVIGCALETVGNTIYGLWPDLVIFVSAFWVPTDLLEVIRARGQRAVLLATESPYEDDRHIKLAPYFDAVVLNDPTNLDQVRAGCPATFYAAHSYDPRIHTPGPAVDQLRSDVCIVGTGYPSRVEFLEQVAWPTENVALLGNWEPAAGSTIERLVRQPSLNHCISNIAAVPWYRSTKSSLNLYRREANRPDLSAGWSMGPREVELAATGTFFFTERRGENRQVLPMVPTVDGPADYAEQLAWWLDHDHARARVVGQAREAVADFTFTNRAARLLAALDRSPVTV